MTDGRGANRVAAARADSRALRRLAANHPDEYLALRNEERASEGLPPVGAARRGRPPTERG